MKKFVAILLTLMLVLGVSAAFADEFTSTPTFTKVLHIANEGTTAPATTFEFTAEFDHVEDGNGHTLTGVNAPAITLSDAVFTATSTDASIDVEINAGAFPVVGVYFYTVTEAASSNAGIYNHAEKMLLKVTVTNAGNGLFAETYAFYADKDASKNDTVTNTYKAGKLDISKKVEGNLGDESKYFKFTVTLKGEKGKTYADSYAVSGGSYAENPTSVEVGGTYTFHLKHDDIITIANLPYEVEYVVSEDKEDYTANIEKAEGKISAASQSADFVNTKTGDIDMGVTTENLPYVLLIGFVVLAGAALLLKRKAHNN